MRNAVVVILFVSVINTLAQTESNPSTRLNTRSDSLNYFLGLSIGFGMETAPFKANAALISEGLKLAIEGRSQYNQETVKVIFQALQMAVRQEQAKMAEEAGSRNLEKGNAFLSETGKRDGVITTESGLRYEVITMGDGPMPTDTSTVEVHYEGTLIDGTLFDSSYERGEPLTLPLNRVIAGWTEGVQLMPVGSTFKFYIPSDLGYGPRTQGSIPAHSTLIFKIELLGIQ